MHKKLPFFLIFLFVFFQTVSGQQHTPLDFRFQDAGLTFEERLEDLVSRLSLEEKTALMLYNSPAIEHLNIPSYNWWNECLHGVGRAGKATVFPQAIGLAATFDEDLILRVASAISDEARAKHQAAVKKNNRAQYAGLSFWTPNINIFRDPRWGRGQETYGEDPYLTSQIGIAFVRGLQGNDSKYLKAAACAKHYVVHSGPEKTRHQFNAVPDERDFREVYLPGFQALVQEGKVESVMCAYNRTYDKPCCGSEYLLNSILRKEWGFSGHVVSDCWALDDIWARHKVVDERVDAAAMAATAGVNLNCGYIYEYLPEAVHSGLISEREVDDILKPLLKTRFRLGLFDAVDATPWADISEDTVNCAAHVGLALEAARKSIVLLKNKNNVLPLNKDSIRNLFVSGPTAADITALLGNYNGFSGNLNTMLEGFINRVDAATIVEYNQGFMFHNDSLFHGFWQAARAEAVVVCLGINALYEGEEGDAMLNPNGGDRATIELPPNQLKYLRLIRENIQDKPLIVVITGGSAVAMPEVDKLADAILFAWYPGEQGGNAVADVVFGNCNPSGRLPVTFYRSTEDLPPFDDYSMDGRTYRYFDGKPLYPFGMGLSYSTFDYSEPSIELEGEAIRFRFELTNSGSRSGDEVVQVYARKLDPQHWRPRKQLVAFKRVPLNAGAQTVVEISVDSQQLKYWDVTKSTYSLEPGTYEFLFGSSSEDIRTSTSFTIP